MMAQQLARPAELAHEAANAATDDQARARLALAADALREAPGIESPVLQNDVLEDAIIHLNAALKRDPGSDARVAARNALQMVYSAVDPDVPVPDRYAEAPIQEVGRDA